MSKLATDIFLKGYQWPFDSRKVQNYGSSIIDILVYQENVLKNRNVYLDFRKNPNGGGLLKDFDFDQLEPEAYNYLKNSDALFGTPIERLQKMNPLSIKLYQEQNINIAAEPLEIAVCAQHNNGGLTGDIWWQSNIKNLFPIGEVNGSHGVYRPGGAALNSGQVGGYRSAEYISAKGSRMIPDLKSFLHSVTPVVNDKINEIVYLDQHKNKNSVFCSDIRNEIQERMTSFGSHIREYKKIKSAISDAYKIKEKITKEISIKSRKEITFALQNKMLWITHLAYLESIRDYLDEGGGSRGSYLIMDPNGEIISEYLAPYWKYKPENVELRNKIQTIQYSENELIKKWVSVREIPKDDFWFENVWRDYREKKIYE
jgi:succinate dehydrogenase/fumarate reductase flavoprotein subunit